MGLVRDPVAGGSMHVQQEFLRRVSAIRGFLVGLLADLDTADDVLQEVFLTVTEKAVEFEPGSDFMAWVRAIARLKVLEHWKASSRAPRPFATEVVEALVASAPGTEQDFSERRGALRDCLARLARTARRILELRYTDRLSSREIAERLAWKPQAVDVALSKARRFLRDCVRRTLGLARGQS